MNESNFDRQVGLRGNRQWGDEVRSSLQHHSDIRHADTWKVTWLWFLSVTVQFKRGWHWKVTWLWFLSVTVQFKRGWQWGSTWNPPTPTTASLITCSKTRSTPPSLDRKRLQRRGKKKPVNVTFLFCTVCFPLALTQNSEQQRVLPGRAYWWNWTQLDQNRIQQMGRSHPPSSFVLCHGCMHSGYPGKFQHLKVLECTQSPLTSNPDSFWKQLALVDIFKTLLC